MESDDNKIIAAVLAGNQDAFAWIVNKYKAYIFAIILNMGYHDMDAENIAQEVFLQTYRSLDKFTEGNFKAWIGKITVRKVLDYRRAEERRQETLEEDEILSGNVSYSAIEDNNPLAVLIREEKKNRVQQICVRLPDMYKNAIIDSYLHGMSNNELAEKERTTVRNIESRLYRARKMFRKLWEEEEG